jgi:hypothetical protein
MNTPLLRLLVSLVLICPGIQPALAGETSFSAEDPDKLMKILNSDWGDFGVSIVASKEWGKENYKPDFKTVETLVDSQGKMKRKVLCTAPSGETLSVDLDASANGPAVDLVSTLESSTPLPGSFHLTLSVPFPTASDLTVLADGNPMTTNLDRGAIRNKPAEISLVKTSTGQTLFKATGEFGSVRTHFFKDNDKLPLTVWLTPAEKTAESQSPFTFPVHLEFGAP